MVDILDPFEHITWSGDVKDDDTLFATLDQTPHLRYIKIDRNYVEGRNFDVFYRLRERGLKVFDDAKIIEIGPKVVELVKKHLPHQPYMLNCMAGCESTGFMTHENPDLVDTLKRFADLCLGAGVEPCGVTVLSTKTEDVVRREFNGRNPVEQVYYYLDVLMSCGFTNAVCAAKEVAAIRQESRFNKLVLNPAGVRPAGSAADDQVRAETPEAIMAVGGLNTRMVIGRPITKGDPAKNLRKIAASITPAA
jgi:orotidine-5'-phosphate decarboxylase